MKEKIKMGTWNEGKKIKMGTLECTLNGKKIKMCTWNEGKK